MSRWGVPRIYHLGDFGSPIPPSLVFHLLWHAVGGSSWQGGTLTPVPWATSLAGSTYPPTPGRPVAWAYTNGGVGITGAGLYRDSVGNWLLTSGFLSDGPPSAGRPPFDPSLDPPPRWGSQVLSAGLPPVPTVDSEFVMLAETWAVSAPAAAHGIDSLSRSYGWDFAPLGATTDTSVFGFVACVDLGEVSLLDNILVAHRWRTFEGGVSADGVSAPDPPRYYAGSPADSWHRVTENLSLFAGATLYNPDGYPSYTGGPRPSGVAWIEVNPAGFGLNTGVVILRNPGFAPQHWYAFTPGVWITQVDGDHQRAQDCWCLLRSASTEFGVATAVADARQWTTLVQVYAPYVLGTAPLPWMDERVTRMATWALKFPNQGRTYAQVFPQTTIFGHGLINDPRQPSLADITTTYIMHDDGTVDPLFVLDQTDSRYTWLDVERHRAAGQEHMGPTFAERVAGDFLFGDPLPTYCMTWDGWTSAQADNPGDLVTLHLWRLDGTTISDWKHIAELTQEQAWFGSPIITGVVAYRTPDNAGTTFTTVTGDALEIAFCTSGVLGGRSDVAGAYGGAVVYLVIWGVLTGRTVRQPMGTLPNFRYGIMPRLWIDST